MGKKYSLNDLFLNDRSAASWTSQNSADLYGIQNWGAGYFEIDDAGKLCVQAADEKGGIGRVRLLDIIQGMQDRGLETPVIVRIANILDDRIRVLNESFSQAIADAGYQNHYRGVFPIKVNQQRHVIEEIADFGARFHHGLEAGSKAELVIALAHLNDQQSLIVCNGYKDAEFIDLGLYACEMGVRCFFVLETPLELDLIIERSQALGIEPLLGVRLRSTVAVDGYWNSDSGDRSIFGMSSNALLKIVDQLKQNDLLHCLQLLHCHLGSQIPSIRSIRSGVQEACRFYCGMQAEGAPMGYLDLGGGLAVDYEGTRANSTHSMNYQVQEYCSNIVETIVESLDGEGVAHPVIITESGRATVAYSSLLVFEVLEVRDHRPAALPDSLPSDTPELVKNLWDVLTHVDERDLQECFNDALFYRDAVRNDFQHGRAGLRDRAIADNLALAILQAVRERLEGMQQVPPDLESLRELLADTYYGNFSLFQSLPDSWAIDQVFPVLPLHRLDEKPDRHAVIADMTCDCDGKLNRFVIDAEVRETLPLHPLEADRPYYLGVFLVGAYQETLGDLHNLFGDTNVVSVHVHADGRFDFVREFHGDSIADVLSYVEYDPATLEEHIRQRAEQAVRDGVISAQQRKRMMRALKESLAGYTYYEREVGES